MPKLIDVIAKANLVHNGKYDYSLVKSYKNNKEHYPVICHCKDEFGNEHGIFETTFSRHINRKQGCPKCKKEKLHDLFAISNDNFILKCKKKFGDTFSFDKTKYVNAFTNVTVTCNIHGDITVNPREFLKSLGCHKCAHGTESKKMTLSELKERLDKKHKGNVIPLFNELKGVDSIGTFYCIKHDNTFNETSSNAMKKFGCKYCQKEQREKNLSKRKDSFIERATMVHDKKYSFDDLIYKGIKRRGIITCKIHGNFSIKLENLLKGQGCPKCKQSIGEASIERKLLNENIEFKQEETFSFLKNGHRTKRLDFYIPRLKIAIEYQGRQHFEVIEFFGGELGFQERLQRDILKNKLCNENGIDIFYIISPKDLEKSKSIPIYNKHNTFTSIDECIEVITEKYKNT